MLSREVMLGGWLHRHTCFVVSKTMRHEVGRLRREDAEANAPVTQDMVESRCKRAHELARSGDAAAALEEFLWCFDQGMPRLSSFAGVRTSFLSSSIAKLGETYPEVIRKTQREYLITSTARNIELRAGVGDLDHARSLAARLLTFDGSPDTKALLQQHVARAGQPALIDGTPKP